MKSKLLLFAIIATTFFSTACKKESEAPIYPIEGYWTGTYSDPDILFPFTFVAEKGGSIVVSNGATFDPEYMGFGTWTLDGDVFTAKYQFRFYSKGAPIYTLLKATWTNDGKLTNGTWGTGESYTNGGTFSMSRTN